MGYEKFKHPLREHCYALYPLVAVISVIIISCRIAALSHMRALHQIPSPWSTVVSFGDSFSDSGNAAQITNGKYPTEPWYWHQRFSNGPNWIDNLIMDFGGLEKIKMRNFAHGGASSDNVLMKGNIFEHVIPGTHQQVRGFIFKSRQTGYPAQESTLYTMWTGANDCLAMGGVETFKPERNFTVGDIEESIFQSILQLERESHNKIRYMLILTPPPVEDMPMIRNEKADNRPAVQQAAESLTRTLPFSLLEKFKTIGNAVLTNNVKLAPEHPPRTLPEHRTRSEFPISHFLTVDLPESYAHTVAREHNGAKANSSSPPAALLSLRPMPPMPGGLHGPLLKLRKREDPALPDDEQQSQLDKIVSTSGSHAGAGSSNKLHIMIYDAYHFIKHAEENPRCFDLSAQSATQPCGEQQDCYDRVWMDDTNINTSIHYWMARDINIRLHL
ncbi:hypothetical protein GGI12_002874, partial [Dipsacomyces acuminosporus]